MLNFGTKTNDTAGAGGQVEDTEYNSLFSEVKNVITKTGIALDGGKTDQMIKAIDKISKATNYEDSGTANTIQLTRQATGETIEELFDGMVVYFSPKFANTGATTLKVATLLAKPAKYLGIDVTADFFKVGYNYKAVYDLGNEWFECDVVANKKYVEEQGVIDINSLTNKTTPVNTDNYVIQEVGGQLKKVSHLNLKSQIGEATWVANDSRAKTALNASGSARIYACRAWVNFKGTGVVAIRASGNVSSITDLGIGQYQANFITSMPDTNYSFSVCGDRNSFGGYTLASPVKTTTAFKFDYLNSASDVIDVEQGSLQIFR